jgi:hypothetical protein
MATYWMGVLTMQVDWSASWAGYGVLLLLAAALAVLAGAFASPSAQAERIENATANFAALDKVSATVKQLPVPLNKTETFRTLKITPRVCFTSDPSEPPRTSTFVEVDEVQFDGSEKRIFSGWMFAESPGLNPMVHAVFDIWLTGCSQPKTTTASKAPPGSGAPDAPPPPTLKRPRPPR